MSETKCECGCGQSCRNRFALGHATRAKRLPMRDYGDYVEIDMGGKGWFKVDAADAAEVSRRAWHLSAQGYPSATIDGRVTTLHRFLLGLKSGDRLLVDHKNRDRLDNRRANLRLGSQAMNAQNRNPLGGSSKFRGVSWDRARSCWETHAKINGRSYFLGRFDDELEAAETVAEFRAKHMPFSNEATEREAACVR
jgi:hypothetical protein